MSLLPTVLLMLAEIAGIQEVCDPPSVDPKAPAPYCVLDEVTLIETPYYSLVIQPRQIVHLLDEGRFLEVLPSIRQSPVGLGIRVDGQPEEQILRSLAYHGCPDARLEQGRLLRCERISDEGYVTREYAGRSGEHLVVVGFYTGPRASPEDDAKFELMLESMVLKP